MIKSSRSYTRGFGIQLAVQLLTLFAFGLSGTVLCAQTVAIKLVNGRNGRPMASTYVNVWVGNERKAAIVVPTDRNGVAWLRLTDKDSEIDIHNRVVKYDDHLRINVGFVLCQVRKSDYSWLAITDFSMKEVLQHGVVTSNTCGKATAASETGEVTIFVRPLSWWEKLKQ